MQASTIAEIRMALRSENNRRFSLATENGQLSRQST
jgi:hypothetical protein